MRQRDKLTIKSLYLPDWLIKEIETRAKADKRTFGAFVRNYLEDTFRRPKCP